MNRTNRGPILLTLAGVLLLFVLVVYLINDAEYNQARHEAALHQRELQRRENERSVADRAELHRRQNMIIESLKRLEAWEAEISAIRDQVGKSRQDRDDQRIDNQEAHRERAEIRRRQELIENMLRDIAEKLNGAPAHKPTP